MSANEIRELTESNQFGKFASNIVGGIIGSNLKVEEDFYEWNGNSWYEKLFISGLKVTSSDPRSLAVVTVTLLLAFASTFVAVVIYYWSLKIELSPDRLWTQRRNEAKHVKRRRMDSQSCKTIKYIFLLCGVFVSAAVVVSGVVFMMYGLKNLNMTSSHALNELRTNMKIIDRILSSLKTMIYRLPVETVRQVVYIVEGLLEIPHKTIESYKRYVARTLTLPLRTLTFVVQAYMMKFKEIASMEIDKYKKFNATSVALHKELGQIVQKSESFNITNLTSLVNTVSQWVESTEYLTKLQGEYVKDLHRFEKLPLRNILVPVAKLGNVPRTMTINSIDALRRIKNAVNNIIVEKLNLSKHLTNHVDGLFPYKNLDKLEVLNNNTRDLFAKVALFTRPITVIPLSLVIPITIGTVLGLIGTNCLARCKMVGYHQNQLSNSGGNIVESGLYVTSAFVWLFWIFSALLFIMAITPIIVCKEMTRDSNETLTNRERNSTFKFSEWLLILRNCDVQDTTVDLRDLVKIAQKDFVAVVNYTFGNEARQRISKIPKINISTLKSQFIHVNVTKEVLSFKMIKLKLLNQSFQNAEMQIKHAFDSATQLLNSEALPPVDRKVLLDIQNMLKQISGSIKAFKFDLQKFLSDVSKREYFVESAETALKRLISVGQDFNNFTSQNASKVVQDEFDRWDTAVTNGFSNASSYALSIIKKNTERCNTFEGSCRRVISYTCNIVINGLTSMWLACVTIATFLLVMIACSVPTIWLFKTSTSRDSTGGIASDQFELDPNMTMVQSRRFTDSTANSVETEDITFSGRRSLPERRSGVPFDDRIVDIVKLDKSRRSLGITLHKYLPE